MTDEVPRRMRIRLRIEVVILLTTGMLGVGGLLTSFNNDSREIIDVRGFLLSLAISGLTCARLAFLLQQLDDL